MGFLLWHELQVKSKFSGHSHQFCAIIAQLILQQGSLWVGVFTAGLVSRYLFLWPEEYFLEAKRLKCKGEDSAGNGSASLYPMSCVHIGVGDATTMSIFRELLFAMFVLLTYLFLSQILSMNYILKLCKGVMLHISKEFLKIYLHFVSFEM